MTDRVVAAVDCGTNSTRLLVSSGGTQALERLTTITRLGEGVDATGRLAPAAIDRVVRCLAGYRERMDAHAVTSMRITATSAARDAVNRDELFDAIGAVAGSRPELLSGREEARLAFDGATAELDAAGGPYLVVDIGGGSTEFAVGGPELVDAVSVDMGCVRTTEQFLSGDPPRPEELSACISVIGLHLDDVGRELPAVATARRLVGLAGTVSAAAAIELGLGEYDRDAIHHFVLTKATVEEIFRSVATETADERAENPGLEPGRVDTIVGGLCILVKVMRQFGFDECLVSESDILDGLVASQL
ncbi:MAG: Ppx/GppA family phosphatase [Acidimicrobiia bacterium]|nr:Ppx/GppA family phosphatase [Acidimicrobiia bacterium]